MASRISFGGLSSGSASCIAAFAKISPGTITRIYSLIEDEKLACRLLSAAGGRAIYMVTLSGGSATILTWVYKAGHCEEALKPYQQAALTENAVKAGMAAVKHGASFFSAKAADVENAEELLQPQWP
jgi:hypothetical protein